MTALPVTLNPGGGTGAMAGEASPAIATPAVVEAVAVTKRYGGTAALDDVAITVAAGETHALVGRNGAGKSTLVSIITGLQAPDEGRVLFHGEPAPSLSDRGGWRSLVACVYQKPNVIPTLSVAENLFLNRQVASATRPISWKRLRDDARDLLESYGVDIDPSATADMLTVEQRQFVEIARALTAGARFVILDEPTAALERPAIAKLYTHLRRLQEHGVTILYISHHLREVFDLCDTVTVLRDARHIGTAPVASLTEDDLVSMMTGDTVSRRPWRTPTSDTAAAPALAVRGLAKAGRYDDVSFELRPGEIVGLAGVGSSGKVEVARAIVGTDRADQGTVEIGGTAVRTGSVAATLRAGLGFVPEDRHAEGLVPLLSVAENATLTVTDRLGRAGFISGGARDRLAAKAIADLDIRTDGPSQPVGSLSGGNAQKVVMSRALARQPRVLVLITPTAGVDVQSKESLLDVVDDAAAQGTAALIVSDELPDLRVCDRILVMNEGRITREISAGWGDDELVGAMEGIGTATTDTKELNQ